MAPINSDEPMHGSGFWGPTTSTLDWCEKNYEVTYYAAEFWNTVTNLGMILPALHGIYDSYKQGFEFRYMFCFVLLLMVGIGSWMFHMTLLFEMQLMDELPMVWGVAYIYYCLSKAETGFDSEGKDRVGSYMFIYALVVSVAYLVNKNPLFHEVAYGIVVVLMLIKAIQLQKKNGKFIKVPLFHLGCIMYAVGFILWNIDNHFCRQITIFREDYLRPKPPTHQAVAVEGVGLDGGGVDLGEASLSSSSSSKFPMTGVWDLSVLTQLHGWWHLLAGYATYVHILFCIHNRLIYLNTDCSIVWSWATGLKVVTAASTAPENSSSSKLK